MKVKVKILNFKTKLYNYNNLKILFKMKIQKSNKDSLKFNNNKNNPVSK